MSLSQRTFYWIDSSLVTIAPQDLSMLLQPCYAAKESHFRVHIRATLNKSSSLPGSNLYPIFLEMTFKP